MKSSVGIYLPWKIRISGVVFLLIDVLLVLAAWNTGTNLYYLLFAAIGAFIALSLVLTGLSLRGLELRRDTSDGVHRDEPFGVHVILENTRRFIPALAVRIESAHKRGVSVGFTPLIPPRRAAFLTLTERLPRRGLHALPPLEIVTTSPFGLFERRKRLRDKTEVMVYPRIVPLRTAAVDKTPHGGSITRRTRGQGDEFFSLREYVPGDDIRHIAWRVSARVGTPFVRELEQETTRTVVFVLDTRRETPKSDIDQDFESAIELVASLAVSLLLRQYTVGLVAGGDFLPEGEGKAQIIQVLRRLALLEPLPSTSPDPFASLGGAEDARGKAAYLCISPDPAVWGQRVAPGGLRVLDPREVLHA